MNKILLALCIFTVLCGCTKKPVYPEAPFEGGRVKIGLSGLQEKRPAFFSVHEGDEVIDFFVLRSGDSVQSYFDACAKCYPNKHGYRFDGRRVVCRKCDVNYAMEDLKDGVGSCYPIKLPGRVAGNFYLIDKKDITAGRKYF